MLVVSYMPLMNLTPVILVENNIKIFAETASAACELACGKGILWARNDTLTPVLIFDKGNAIVEHLIFWSEGKPDGWFDLHIVELDSGKIQFLISPRFMKSVERHTRLYPDSDTASVKVMFAPLQVTIDKSDVCSEFLNNLKESRLTIGFLDYEYVMLGDPTKLKIDKVTKTLDFNLISVSDNAAVAEVSVFIDGKVVKDYGLLDANV